MRAPQSLWEHSITDSWKYLHIFDKNLWASINQHFQHNEPKYMVKSGRVRFSRHVLVYGFLISLRDLERLFKEESSTVPLCLLAQTLCRVIQRRLSGHFLTKWFVQSIMC